MIPPPATGAGCATGELQVGRQVIGAAPFRDAARLSRRLCRTSAFARRLGLSARSSRRLQGLVAPVTKLDLSEQSQITASAISLGFASRTSGRSAILAAITFGGRSAIRGVSTIPGAMALTRMPSAA